MFLEVKGGWLETDNTRGGWGGTVSAARLEWTADYFMKAATPQGRRGACTVPCLISCLPVTPNQPHPRAALSSGLSVFPQQHFRNGVLRTQKLRSLPSTENPEPSKLLSSKPESDQNIALHAIPAARNSVLLIPALSLHSALFLPQILVRYK